MAPWSFVIAAYAVTFTGAGALALTAFLAMRRAEKPVVGDVER